LERTRHGLKPDQRLYVNILEILDNALRVAEKTEVSERRYLKFIYDPSIDPKYAVFIPYPRVFDKYLIPLIYRKQLASICSA